LCCLHTQQRQQLLKESVNDEIAKNEIIFATGVRRFDDSNRGQRCYGR
jgi:hypothetical protein